ncbi:MAG: FAD-linked oxidase C-terminal domain-containing protein, partial [Bacteroidota bacterium]
MLQFVKTDLFEDLRRQVDGEVRTDAFSRTLYATDASLYQQTPLGVFFPTSAEDVQRAVRWAARHEVPVLARSAGTSLAGQCVNAALVIDGTKHLTRILEVNVEERWVRAEPGVVLDHLNAHLKPLGLKFGPDPASSNRAALGGIVSNNSTGAHSILYGMTADHVLAVRAVLADGSDVRFGPVEDGDLPAALNGNGPVAEIQRRLRELVSDPANQAIIRAGTPRHWRRCGGYNLDRLGVPGVTYHHDPDPRFNVAKLFSGAEGGFGVLTEVTLNLVPLPAHAALAVVPFESGLDALKAIPAMLETGPSAIELLDHTALTMAREVPEYRRKLDSFVVGDPHCLLLTEFYGDSEADCAAQIDALRWHLKASRLPAGELTALHEPDRMNDVWNVRKGGLGLVMSVKGDAKPVAFIEDAAVPVEHLAAYVDELEAFARLLGTEIIYYAHASAGCVHVRPLINAKLASEIEKMPQILDFAVGLLRGYGGALSSEHGDGKARSWINERFFGRSLYRLYRETKAIFDPTNLMNPGVVVEGPAMTEQLRFGAGYQTIPLKEHLDFSADQGFHRAVEMCNGAGVCRKEHTGTMCPSFMATREEEHSTRGRANLLRAAMSGALPAGTLTSPRMHEAMALCISCKACKAECPSSVDMAKLKLEFQAHYHARHGVSVRSRFFAQVARLSRLNAGALAPLVNRLSARGPARRILNRVLGLAPQRPLPAFARTPFTAWFSARPAPAPTDKTVVLFNDTFNTYNTPSVAIAATEVLERAGYTVVLPGHGCCGRPALSKGLVDEARAMAQETLSKLAPFAERGLPIVGLEPSCILSFDDDYRYLLADDPRVHLVASHAVTFEEFIAGLAERGDLELDFEPAASRVLLHGHCHQKALVGTRSAHETLQAAGCTVEEV